MPRHIMIIHAAPHAGAASGHKHDSQDVKSTRPTYTPIPKKHPTLKEQICGILAAAAGRTEPHTNSHGASITT